MHVLFCHCGCAKELGFSPSLVHIVLFLFLLTWQCLQPATEKLYYRGIFGGRKKWKEEGSFTCLTEQGSKPKVPTEAAKEADA